MKRPGKLIALMLFLVSCGTQEKDLYVVRGQIHNLAMKESPEKAHALFLKFADDCHAKGDYDMEACGLYEMATNYLDQRDTLGLRRILDRMERLSGEHPESLGAGYSYYSVLGTYYAVLYEQDGLDTTRETLFAALRRAIDYQEQMSQEDYRRQSIITAWNYYNVAVSYDLYCDPPIRDSIAKYLDLTDKANREATHMLPFEHQQIDISVRDLRAWLLYYDGKNKEAVEEKSTEEIAETMHVAPASVYTMKYRIKKKYPDSFPLPF